MDYQPGTSYNPRKHLLTLQIANTADTRECRYRLETPEWLNSVASGVIPDGAVRTTSLGLNAESVAAQTPQQEYREKIVVKFDTAPSREIPVTLITGCRIDEVCLYRHASHTEIPAGQTAELSYAINNQADYPATARLTLELPSGWSLAGEGFAEKCSGICTANYAIGANDQRYIVINATPNQPGEFELIGIAEYQLQTPGVTASSAGSRQAVNIRVLPARLRQPATRESSPTAAPTPTAGPTPTTSPTPAIRLQLTATAPPATETATPLPAIEEPLAQPHRSRRQPSESTTALIWTGTTA